ncbi:DUF4136 domain-containing protein [Faecalibacter bovis]|uniref:DUF4136 domain-containing protein n=1 Tax=Faecalibacter bovis TaxID=2898187 RepID=A0ABX7XAW1_9FLAO|nr:DUF4136 domain-containing protein [Faecalibacter bovis]MBS7333964.1 DUF4136 domain-containing protein [Weeksellaceae bacterium]QTV04937.1 DUF4136 domain-containing protein [Faecalibacter bovis]
MKNISLFVALFSFILLASCNAVNVATDYDRTANFNTYKTYSYHQKGIDKLSINDLDKNRIISSIDKEMATKGFTKVTSGADLVVNILASSTQEVRVDNDIYGYGYWGGYPSVSDYTAGKIIIDIIDDKKNILVWQGVGSDLNISNISAKNDKIPQAINEILSKFPPLAK